MATKGTSESGSSSGSDSDNEEAPSDSDAQSELNKDAPAAAARRHVRTKNTEMEVASDRNPPQCESCFKFGTDFEEKCYVCYSNIYVAM